MASAVQENRGGLLMKEQFNIDWSDILDLDIRIKKKLHLTTDNLALTIEDVDLINKARYVDLEELRTMLKDIAKFTNTEIEQETGMSRASYSMVFGSEDRKNLRNISPRMVVSLLNAIRNRKISESFNKILIQ